MGRSFFVMIRFVTICSGMQNGFRDGEREKPRLIPPRFSAHTPVVIAVGFRDTSTRPEIPRTAKCVLFRCAVHPQTPRYRPQTAFQTFLRRFGSHGFCPSRNIHRQALSKTAVHRSLPQVPALRLLRSFRPVPGVRPGSHRCLVLYAYKIPIFRCVWIRSRQISAADLPPFHRN